MSRTHRNNYNKNNKMEKQIWDKDNKNRKIDRSCLNNGDCPYCKENRLHSRRRDEYNSKEKLCEQKK